MSEIYTTGSWKPSLGREQAFVEAWAEFATWASTMEGAERLRLVRDLRQPERFVSFGSWETIEAVRRWKSMPEFRERLAHVLQNVDDFRPSELELVATANQGAATAGAATADHSAKQEETVSVHYKKEGIATFDAPRERVFEYMSVGNHPHAAFKSHRLVAVEQNVVTVAAEIYNPDGSTFETTIEHGLDPPHGLETRMTGGPFDGARFVHSYTQVGDRTSVDLEGDFPALPGKSEADELKMIDEFFTMVFAEDEATLRAWSPT